MLRVFKNRVLRRLIGPERNQVTGEWRKLHNMELYAVYSSPNISLGKNEIGGACSTYVGEERCILGFDGKS